ncbi:CDP-alcohol phosphatidyltransferase [candidate division TM6 bacterium Zodletone_IIa]|jgi:phosphatidylglycerophosphate synthase|nr:CDP-alcohol phosphatidyltransferase [candidate division TM6 bacterium Zodletone_IIa]MBA4197606.1 CDP-alcohol phosphatidyltransferase [Chitinophaga sp.]
MRHLPKILIYSRLVIGILILTFSFLHIDNYKIIAVVLFAVGLLTDIFDGIIARNLKISTQHLRRLDSTIDQVFFVMVAIATFIECQQFFIDNKVKLIVLFSIEGLTYLICFLKFKKEIATHTISSKIWTLILFATLIQIITTCNSTILFEICFYVGLVTRLEILGIIFLLRKWTNDVPSIYQAVLLRQRKPIKRHKLFNG